MIFHWIVSDMYAYDLHKNAEKPGVISFLSQIFCQKAVQYRKGKFQYFEKSIQRIFLKIKFAINFWVCSLKILLIHITIMSSSLATAKQAILHNIAIAE